jgi:hypothetical protein
MWRNRNLPLPALFLYLAGLSCVAGGCHRGSLTTRSELQPSLNGYAELSQVIRPEWKREATEAQLSRVISVGIRHIRVDTLFSGWPYKGEAETALSLVLNRSELTVWSQPQWSTLGFPLDLVGTITYGNGSTGRIAVSEWKVGFEDSRRHTWYFQWEERVPND